MAIQINSFLYEVCKPEDVEMTERIGFFQNLDLITLREKLRKHGVRT